MICIGHCPQQEDKNCSSSHNGRHTTATIAECKQSPGESKEAGLPDYDHPLSEVRRHHKYMLRQRCTNYMKRDNFYKQIMDADSGNQKLFHKLIARQRKSYTNHDGELVADGETGLATPLTYPS